jgi:hypothetical protein
MSAPGKLVRSSRWKSGPSKGQRPLGSECCVAIGDSGCGAYTAARAVKALHRRGIGLSQTLRHSASVFGLAFQFSHLEPGSPAPIAGFLQFRNHDLLFARGTPGSVVGISRAMLATRSLAIASNALPSARAVAFAPVNTCQRRTATST